MAEEGTRAVVPTPTSLPDEASFKSGLEAIRRFQAIAKSQMIEGHDFGVIPGTQKPTLLKPGAEKITKLLGLADEYVVLEQVQDWIKGFFHYTIKAQLRHLGSGVVVSEGLGECNSMESKYRWRWLFGSQMPEGTLKPNVTRIIKTKRGDAKQYRFDNDDIYSQVNTILKMAKKRAMVDAALSAGRLSDVFTQDIEDTVSQAEEPEAPVKPPVAEGALPDSPSPPIKMPQAASQSETAGKKAHQKASAEQIDAIRGLMQQQSVSEEQMTKHTMETWGLALGEILPEQADKLVKELKKRLARVKP